MQSPYGHPTQHNQPVQQTSGNNNTLILVIVLAVLFYGYNQGWFDKKPVDPRPNDDIVIVDPDEINVPPKPTDDEKKGQYAADETYIIRIYESKDSNRDWLYGGEQIGNQKFWLGELAERGIRLETFDPVDDDGKPNPQAITYVEAAEKRNIKPPFWLHAHDRTVLSLTPFSEDVTVDTWRKIINANLKD